MDNQQVNHPQQARQSAVSVDMDGNDSYSPLSAREELYQYMIPDDEDGISPEELQLKSNAAITKAMDDDLKKYGFGDPPSKPEDAEQWRVQNEPALFRKIKRIIFSYDESLKDLPKGHTDAELDECIAAIETEEDSYEFARPKTMLSHEDWSKERKRQKDKYDAEEAQGETEREAMLANTEGPPEGWDKGLDSSIAAVIEDIPDAVRIIHATMCVLMFQWWEGGFRKEDSVNLAKCNSRLDMIEGAKSYKVPPTEIALWMPKLKQSLEICEHSPSETNQLELIKTAITLTNKLRKPGLDWKMVISKDTHRRLFSCLEESQSDQVTHLRSLFEEAYLKPHKDQLKELANLDSIFVPLFNNSENPRDRIQFVHLPVCIEQLQVINRKVQTCNLRIGLPRGDHNLPISDLAAALSYHINGDTSAAINSVTHFAHKTLLLNLPVGDLNSHCIGSNGVCDTIKAQQEVLDLYTEPNVSQLVADLPSLTITARPFAFEGVPVRTLAWGDYKGKFFINQYGPLSAPVFRIETSADPDWTRRYGNEPPQSHCVTNVNNRYGDNPDKVTGKKKYGPEFVGTYYGIAFEGSELKAIDPREYEKTPYKERERFPRTYALIGWDLQQQKKDFEKKWETRSTMRRLLPMHEADYAIYNFALESEKRFHKWMSGKTINQESPEQVYRAQEQAAAGLIKKESSEQTSTLAELEAMMPIRNTQRSGLRRRRDSKEAL